jgi:hypothetical protein
MYSTWPIALVGLNPERSSKSAASSCQERSALEMNELSLGLMMNLDSKFALTASSNSPKVKGNCGAKTGLACCPNASPMALHNAATNRQSNSGLDVAGMAFLERLKHSRGVPWGDADPFVADVHNGTTQFARGSHT